MIYQICSVRQPFAYGKKLMRSFFIGMLDDLTASSARTVVRLSSKRESSPEANIGHVWLTYDHQATAKPDMKVIHLYVKSGR